MYQHSDRLHAEILHVPQLHKVPQKPHRCGCPLPRCKGATFAPEPPETPWHQVEEQPRKLEHVIKVSYICLHRDQPQLDAKSEQYLTEVCTRNRTR